MNKIFKSIISSVVLSAVLISSAGATEFIPPIQGEAVKGRIITPKCGDLIYNPYNEMGDTLGDFSYAGFYAGRYEIPDTSQMSPYVTLIPFGSDTFDDTDRIQKAIDNASAASATDNEFKIVKLAAGKYNILKFSGIYLKSGVILAGEGQGPDGTVIVSGPQITGAPINTNKTDKAASVISGRFNITDSYVKAGSYEITVEDASSFSVGDLIKIDQPWTQEWTDKMGMNNLESIYGEEMDWMQADENGNISRATSMERTITDISGNVLTLDMPMYIPLDATCSTPYVYKVDDSKRLENIGIENLRIESSINEQNYACANTAIVFQYVKNSYVRDVSTKYFKYSAITVRNDSKQVTIKNCSYLEPLSPLEGGYRYSFCVGKAQQILVSGCYSYNARHDYTTTGYSTGPVVFVDCVVDSSNQATENHGEWATGTLYDNILSIGNDSKAYMAFTNRGKYGDAGGSHGWAGAGTVAWNCLFSLIAGNKPPMNYNNFIAGQWGYYGDDAAKTQYEKNLAHSRSIYKVNFGNGITDGTDENFKTYENSSIVGDCYTEAEDTTVTPRSLYNAQLSKRLTADRRKAKPTAPVITSPVSESVINNNTIVIKGIKLSIAEKVNVYVDNNKYTAVMNADNTFSLTLPLSDGVHKIYATQTIRGVEGTKCADRFITVNESFGNADYLQSQYEYERIHPVNDDSAISYDVYANIENGLSDEAMPLNVYVNGRILETDVVAVKANGYVLVPVRAVSEMLLCDVVWDPDTNTAVVIKDENSFGITTDSNVVTIGEQLLECDFVARNINGRFMIPADFLAKQLNTEMKFDEKTNSVFIVEKSDKEG